MVASSSEPRNLAEDPRVPLDEGTPILFCLPPGLLTGPLDLRAEGPGPAPDGGARAPRPGSHGLRRLPTREATHLTCATLCPCLGKSLKVLSDSKRMQVSRTARSH